MALDLRPCPGAQNARTCGCDGEGGDAEGGEVEGRSREEEGGTGDCGDGVGQEEPG